MVTSNELAVLAGTAFSLYRCGRYMAYYIAFVSKIVSSPDKDSFSKAIAATIDIIEMIGIITYTIVVIALARALSQALPFSGNTYQT